MPPTFLWVSKIDVKLEVGQNHFRNYHIHVSFQIFGPKSRRISGSKDVAFSSINANNFGNSVTQIPTWHQILKPIRMLAATFILYTSIYIHVLYSHKVWRTLKDTFEHQILKPQLKIKRKKNDKFGTKNRKVTYLCKFENFDPHPQLDIKFWNP